MIDQDAALKELKLILKVLILANADAIEKELSRIATTDERKKMWVLIDGKRMPKNIAKEAGVTPMTVSNFLNAVTAAELIEYTQREPPRRILDYVPPPWIDLIIKEKGEAETEQGASKEEESEKQTDQRKPSMGGEPNI